MIVKNLFDIKKKYRLIYADPPWAYRDALKFKKTESNPRGASHHYNLMSTNDIKNIPIKYISQDNACCFIWVTVPFLVEGLSVLKSWGFNYKTALFWHKIKSLGMGYWFRNNMEICLVGIKGKIKAFRQQISNVVMHPPASHSTKPKRYYVILEGLNINPKIELFARDMREGWDVWGNQLSKTTQRVFKPYIFNT